MLCIAPDTTAATFPRLSVGIEAFDDGFGRERRRRVRRVEHRAIKLFDETTGSYVVGRTRDTSDTGLQIELPDRVPAKRGGTAFIHVADGRGMVRRTAMMPVRYAWVRREGKRLFCGVEMLAATTPMQRAA
jgi:hypothetical protein